MFTGLIETIGRVINIDKQAKDGRFQISPQKSFTDLQFGESIALNGACLTVENISEQNFQVFASQETLSKTSLVYLRRGDLINLERAVSVGSRLGGHFVSGHVDCLSRVQKIDTAGESYLIGLEFPKEWSDYLVDKGSIALDGVSLTVNSCRTGYLEVNVIPTTWKETVICRWKTGTQVNMETDLLAKYVAQMLGPWGVKKTTKIKEGGQGFSENFLREQGFL